MTLVEALKLVQSSRTASADPFRAALVCGFTPLHLQTFLHAELQTAYPSRRVEIQTGHFGDLTGTLRSAVREPLDAIALVIEWADLDARLGTRQLGGWAPGQMTDIVERVSGVLDHITQLAAELTCPLAITLPTLPLPPLFTPPGWQAGSHELQLRAAISGFASKLAARRNVRITSEQRLGEQSPPAQRFSAKAEWTAGFPYHVPHASAVAALLASALAVPAPKKGLITDLDNTVWRGIVGDVGIPNICWDLDRKAHHHGFYQQMLSTLAEEGVLIAIASKNDPAVVREALDRADLFLPKNRIFPIEVSWGAKAKAVSRILEVWNIAADAVVFVDDSPAEVAEVKAAHPAVETFLFPENDAQGVYDLCAKLRDLFGKATVSAEDSIRLDSIRASAVFRESNTGSEAFSETLLQGADAELTLSLRKDISDTRAFELINKTNQFNLNGKRVAEAGWREWLERNDTFLITATYKDRFGALGKIAVLSGCRHQSHVCVHHWVMSCRAFCRRIEHQCLSALFEHLNTDKVVFNYVETPRNGPARDFFAEFGDPAPGDFAIERDQFMAKCPKLYHRVITEQ